MPKTDVFYFEGLNDILIAMMTTKETVSTPPQYGEVIRLPIATKLKVKGNGSELEKWASSKMFRRVSRETKHEIGLDHVGIPIELMDQIKGLAVKNGVTFGRNNARELPYFAFGFIGDIEGGGKKIVWYPKTQLSIVVDEEYATAEEDTKIDDVTANLVATGLLNNGVMYSSFDSNRDSALDVSPGKFIDQPVYDEDQWDSLLNIPSAPKLVTGQIKTDGSVELDWDIVLGAKSYLIHYADANETDPHRAIYMGYSETSSWTLAAKDVPTHVAGDKIPFFVQTYNVLGVGATDVDKARNLHDNQHLTGSAWSDPYIAEFN